MRSPRVLWLFLVLVLVSCRDAPTAAKVQVQPGRFHATLSGAVSAEMEGAAWMESPLGTREVFLHTADGSQTISFTPAIFGSGGFDFRVGTHGVGSVLGGGVLDATLTTSSQEDLYLAMSGKLRITESTPEGVVAEFDFQALGDPAGARKQVRVRGAFHAVPVR